MNTFVWCEDTGSGFTFWKMIFNTLYKGFIVESKRSNSELCKAVARLKADDDNKYYVVMDYVIDNPDVLREIHRLNSVIKSKSNVSAVNIHSFEFVLFSFPMLEDWVFAQEDDLKDRRKKLLEFKEVFVDIICNGGDIQMLSSLREAVNLSETMNTEQIAAKMLFEITRNTGFETTKSKVGACFTVDCCKWNERQSNDICGLDERRLTADEKAKVIFEHSVLKDSFAKAGL